MITSLGEYTNVIIFCVIVSVGGLLFGFDTGIISGITEMKAFIASFGRSVKTEGGEGLIALDGETLEYWVYSLMVGIPSLGMCLGALGSGACGDKIGRKSSIIYATVVFCVGVLLQVVTSAFLSIFLIGRLIAGLGIGLLSGLVPVYQAECAPRKIRGALISTYQLAITIGIELSNIANFLTNDYRDARAYRIPIGLQFVFAAFLLFGMFLVPESPRYLYSIGKEHEAAEAILYVHNTKTMSKEIQEELSEIGYDIEKSRSLGKSTYKVLFSKSHRGRTAIAAASQFFQQFTGINFIFYFGVTFFKDAGLYNAYHGTMIAGAVNVLSTIPAIYLVDTIGRRALLLGGAAAMFVSQVAVGIMGLMPSAPSAPSSDPTGSGSKFGTPILVFSCIFVAAFAISWGIGAWIVCSEVFSQNTRSKGNSLAVATNWIANSAIGFFTPALVKEDAAGWGAAIGLFWAAFIFAALVYVYFFVPETKGLSLETINRLFNEGVPARDVKAWANARITTEALNEDSLKRAAEAFDHHDTDNNENGNNQTEYAREPLTSSGKE